MAIFFIVFFLLVCFVDVTVFDKLLCLSISKNFLNFRLIQLYQYKDDFQGTNRKKSMNFLKKIEKNLFFSKKRRKGDKKSPRRAKGR
jgi:hypothetical protein